MPKVMKPTAGQGVKLSPKDLEKNTSESYLGICPPCQKAGLCKTHNAKRKNHKKCYGKDRCYCQHDIYNDRINRHAIS